LKKPLSTQQKKKKQLTMPVLSRPLPMTTRRGKRQSEETDATTAKPTKKPRKFSNLSPTSRKVKKQQLAVVVDAAFKRLMAIRCANAGQQRHLDIQKVLDEYNQKDLGCIIERHHLEYRMKMHQKKKKVRINDQIVVTPNNQPTVDANNLPPPTNIALSPNKTNDIFSQVSVLTGDSPKDVHSTTTNSSSFNTVNTPTNSTSTINSSVVCPTINLSVVGTSTEETMMETIDESFDTTNETTNETTNKILVTTTTEGMTATQTKKKEKEEERKDLVRRQIESLPARKKGERMKQQNDV
jgi:hypothetical protein